MEDIEQEIIRRSYYEHVLFSQRQMTELLHAYRDACRRDALEEAARVCADEAARTRELYGERIEGIALEDAAAAIRALAPASAR